MVLGLSTPTFTLLHVIISFIGIGAGFVALSALIRGRWLGRWMALFLIATAATSVTGFFFHSTAIEPPHIVGVISLVVLALALFAIYGRRLVGYWRLIFVVTAVTAQYLNVFVAVAQAFQKIPHLRVLAPEGSEPPFVAAQALVLAMFIAFGYLAARGFRPASAIM